MTNEERVAAGDADVIRLTLPALVPYGRVVRLAVTALASRNGYSYDDVEDIRIAVGEMFAVLVTPETREEDLHFTCTLWPRALEVVGQRSPTTPLPEITELTRQILAAVGDDADFDAPGGTVRYLKRLHP